MAKHNIIPEILQEQKGKAFKNSECSKCFKESWEVKEGVKVKDGILICKKCYISRIKANSKD